MQNNEYALKKLCMYVFLNGVPIWMYFPSYAKESYLSTVFTKPKQILFYWTLSVQL